MFGGGNSQPPVQPPALPDPLPAAPTLMTAQADTPRIEEKKPFGGTLMTGPQGVDESSTNTARHSLLGQ